MQLESKIEARFQTFSFSVKIRGGVSEICEVILLVQLKTKTLIYFRRSAARPARKLESGCQEAQHQNRMPMSERRDTVLYLY